MFGKSLPSRSCPPAQLAGQRQGRRRERGPVVPERAPHLAPGSPGTRGNREYGRCRRRVRRVFRRRDYRRSRSVGAIVRVYDAADSIYSGLVALPWCPSYLAAMWILCGELQSLYAAWIEDDEVPLMASTMDLVREVVIAGESPQAAARACELAAAWEPAIEARENEAPGGPLNVLATFEALAQEIADPTGRYDSANWAANAAEQRWRDWD